MYMSLSNQMLKVPCKSFDAALHIYPFIQMQVPSAPKVMDTWTTDHRIGLESSQGLISCSPSVIFFVCGGGGHYIASETLDRFSSSLPLSLTHSQILNALTAKRKVTSPHPAPIPRNQNQQVRERGRAKGKEKGRDKKDKEEKEGNEEEEE
jgi:hypothetical protein